MRNEISRLTILTVKMIHLVQNILPTHDYATTVLKKGLIAQYIAS